MLLAITSVLFGQTKNGKLSGELKKWHKITLAFEGDGFDETGVENPFLEYRLNVTFKHGAKTYFVPGFFAADGNAAESSAIKGKVWQVRFVPDEVGEWSYSVSFRKGKNIAVNEEPGAGEPVMFDGASGKFNVLASDKTGRDFRSKGRLKYTGERYLSTDLWD